MKKTSVVRIAVGYCHRHILTSQFTVAVAIVDTITAIRPASLLFRLHSSSSISSILTTRSTASSSSSSSLSLSLSDSKTDKDKEEEREEEEEQQQQSRCKSSIKSYRLDGIGYATPKVEIKTNTGHSIQTDIPTTMGGQNTAPQPVEMLVASWMGCTQATALFVGRQILFLSSEGATTMAATGSDTNTGTDADISTATNSRSSSSSSNRSSSNQQQRRRRRQIKIEKIEFDNIVAIRDERGAIQLPIHTTPEIPSRITSITGTIRVFINDLSSSSSSSPSPSSVMLLSESDDDHEQLLLTTEEFNLLKEQTEKRCPIANMILSSGCTIDVDWIQLRTDNTQGGKSSIDTETERETHYVLE